MHLPQYDHTQRGKLHYVLHLAALFVVIILATQIRAVAGQIVIWSVVGTTAVIEFFAFTCISLRVYDDQDCLRLAYGPLPLLKAHIAYEDIVACRSSRSRFIDGWGIHYIPGRGWTYNLWGFDCVELSMVDGKLIRVGTDDREALATFLRTTIDAQLP